MMLFAISSNPYPADTSIFDRSCGDRRSSFPLRLFLPTMPTNFSYMLISTVVVLIGFREMAMGGPEPEREKEAEKEECVEFT
jgi:hypothetical protein